MVVCAAAQTTILKKGMLWGHPKPFSFFFLAACGGEEKRKKEFFGDTPNPGNGLPPLATLLDEARTKKPLPVRHPTPRQWGWRPPAPLLSSYYLWVYIEERIVHKNHY
jgi:hypothetical protein